MIAKLNSWCARLVTEVTSPLFAKATHVNRPEPLEQAWIRDSEALRLALGGEKPSQIRLLK